MPESSILNLLRGGDRRSIGKSDALVDLVLASPEHFGELINGMESDDELIRMRAADAVEKITRIRPELLSPHKSLLLNRLPNIAQQEVRWHLAQLLPRLILTSAERRKVVTIMETFLRDESRIVKTFSMHALADIAQQDENLKPSILKRLKEFVLAGSPAMQSRGRKLAAGLEGKRWSATHGRGKAPK